MRDVETLTRKNPGLKIQDGSQRVLLSEYIAAQTKKTTKYRNVKVYEYADGLVDRNKELTGHGSVVATYDSLKEYQRWRSLLLSEKAGIISELKRQVPIIIEDAQKKEGKNIRPIVYKADHTYLRGNTSVVEDVKPFDKITGKYKFTKDFSLKWKLLQSRYPDVCFEIF